MTAGTTDDFFVETSAAASSPPAEPSPAPAPAASPAPEAVPPSSLPSEPPADAPQGVPLGADDDTDDESPTDPAASDAAKALAGRKKSLRGRIDELTREKWDIKRQYEAEKAQWEARLRALEAGRAPDARPEPESPSYTRPKPTIDQFSDHDAYVEAVADWTVEQKLTARERDAAERAARDEFERTRNAHLARIEAFRAQKPDYDAVLAKAANLPITPAMEQAIIGSEHGPALAYHLATHPAECERLASLPPASALLALGALQASLSRPATATPASSQAASVTRATPPISLVGGSAHVATPPPELIDDLDEYIRVNNAEERRRQQEGLRR